MLSSPVAPPLIVASSDVGGPIAISAWTRISTALRAVNRYGIVVVARWPRGLYWRFLPVEPGERDSPAAPAGSPEPGADTVRLTGFQASPVAIGFTWPSDAPLPGVRAWRLLGPGAAVPVWVRSPLGDVDRRLSLGPTDAMPRGERTNSSQISAWPPTWGPGAYRFDLETAAGIRHIFVVLAPDATGG